MPNQLYILYAVSLLMDMAVAGVVFSVGRRAAELGASAGALGMLGATWLAPYAVMSLISGRLSDRWGRRRVALIGPVLTGAMTLACAATTNVNLLIGLTAVFGLGLGFFWPPVIAWISDGAVGRSLHARLTRFGVAWNIGLFLGFGMTGWVFQRWPGMAFYIPAAVLALIFVLLCVPASPAQDDPLTELSAATETVPAGRGFRKTAWLANFGVRMTNAGVAAIFPQLATHLSIAPDTHGGLLALSNAAALGMIVALQCSVYWHSRLWPLWLAQLLGVLAAATVGIAGQVWLFLAAFVVMGAVGGYSYQASIFFTLQEMTEKGKGSGLHEAFLALGMLTGPLLAGGAGNLVGLRAPYFVCATALLMVILAQVAVVILRRHEYVACRPETRA